MLSINTMAYGTDNFRFRKQALLKSVAFWDFSYETAVNGFDISQTLPDDTNIRVVFVIDDHLFKFGNEGNLIAYNNRGELADILENGNTAGDLLKVTSVPEFCGKMVYPLIAMDAPIDAAIMPKIKISVRVNCYNDNFNPTRYSPIYELDGGNAKIISITADKTLKGNALANINVRFRNKFDTWGDWLELDEAAYKEATALQFRVKYQVSTMDGSESAQVNGITISYSPLASKQVGYITEIVTEAQEFETNLGEVAALIWHDELADCDLTAYVKFSAATAHREDVFLGVTNGNTQTFTLAYDGIVDRNVDQSGLSIMVGGIGCYDFEYDTQNSTVTLKAEKDKTVTATYDCGLNDEYWREIPLDYTRQDGGQFVTRFVEQYNNNEEKKVSAVKFRLTKRNHTGETPEIYKYIAGWSAQI